MFSAVSPEFDNLYRSRRWGRARQLISNGFLNSLGGPYVHRSTTPNYEGSEETYGGSFHYTNIFGWAEVASTHLVPLCRKVRGRVLILGGGAGEEAIALARAGISSIMVERSPTMLKNAALRISRLSPAESGRIEVVREDISLFLHKNAGDQKFNRILALGGVLAFLDSTNLFHQVAKGVSQLLSPDGVFIGSYFNLNYWQTRSRLGRNRFQYWFGRQSESKRYQLWVRTSPIESPGTANGAGRFQFEMLVRALPEGWLRFKPDSAWLFRKAEFCSRINEAGLVVDRIYPVWGQVEPGTAPQSIDLAPEIVFHAISISR